MSIVYDPRRAPQTCDPVPVCPACGGLECLCRPRFFAGQLLTDEDLNRLDTYIRGKNRLHNRMLHGWGTVNGLEVSCTPCGNTVTVSSGYALSPCGEDIVLCDDAIVPICDLINACRDRPEVDCRPYAGRDDDCRDAEQEWVLAICYDETSTRGVTALRGSSAAPSCTHSNGGAAGDCGCQVKADPRAQNGRNRAARAPLAQCEPTAICEGHRFRVYRAPRPEQFVSRDRPAVASLYGPLAIRYRACITAIPELRLATLSENASAQERMAAYRGICGLKAGLGDFLATRGGYSCERAQWLASVPIPAPTEDNVGQFLALYEEARARLDTVREELRRYCQCSMLLPPPPDPVDDDCVPLATITVRGDDCTIVDICNFGVRQIALSVPALMYWLSATPIMRCLNTYLAALCCGERVDSRECSQWLRVALTALGQRLRGGEVQRAVPVDAFRSAMAGQPDPEVDLRRMSYAEIERADFWRASAFDGVIGPLIESIARAPATDRQATGEETLATDSGALRDELAELRQVIRRQQEQIDDLIGGRDAP